MPAFKGNARPWKTVPPEQMGSVVRQLKVYADGALEKSGAALKLTESDTLLVYSDAAPLQVSRFTSLLDRAHRELTGLFGIGKNDTVWYGKPIVFVFSKQSGFAALEKRSRSWERVSKR